MRCTMSENPDLGLSCGAVQIYGLDFADDAVTPAVLSNKLESPSEDEPRRVRISWI